MERYRPPELQEVIKLRSELLLSTVQYARPQFILVDSRPRGLDGEILPTLRWLHDQLPSTRRVIGKEPLAGQCV